MPRAGLVDAFSECCSFDLRDDGRRIVFEKPGEERILVVWGVPDAEIGRLPARLRKGAVAAFGGGPGLDLLVEHVCKAVGTFHGARGQLIAAIHGLRIDE